MQVKSLTSRLRPYAAGASMIGFVAALELQDLVDPTNIGSTGQRLHQAAQQPGRLFAATGWRARPPSTPMARGARSS